MKRFAIFLMLFSVTGVSIAGTLSLKNDLSVGQNTVWPIECQITDANGKMRKVVIPQGERTVLGEITAITKIELSVYKMAYAPVMGKLNLPVYAADTFKQWDDITSKLREVTKGQDKDDFLLTVDWKYPNSYASREWEYTFENLSKYFKFKI